MWLWEYSTEVVYWIRPSLSGIWDPERPETTGKPNNSYVCPLEIGLQRVAGGGEGDYGMVKSTRWSHVIEFCHIYVYLYLSSSSLLESMRSLVKIVNFQSEL